MTDTSEAKPGPEPEASVTRREAKAEEEQPQTREQERPGTVLSGRGTIRAGRLTVRGISDIPAILYGRYALPAVTQVVPIDEVKAQLETIAQVVKEAEAKGDRTIEVRVRSMEQDITLRKVVAFGSMGLFAAMNVGAIVLFYLNGFGKTALSDAALLGLLGATIAEVAGVMFIVARYLFPPPGPTTVMAIPAGEPGEVSGQ